MNKINSFTGLVALRDSIRKKSGWKGETIEIVRIKVAMATCSIASGSRETLNYILDELNKRNIDAVVTQTGCMGYCYAEPTIEVTVPGKEPIVYGYVDARRADEIIEKYIKNGILVEGIIPLNYQKIDQ